MKLMSVSCVKFLTDLLYLNVIKWTRSEIMCICFHLMNMNVPLRVYDIQSS